MNGYTTIGITPELQAHLEREDWSEPVRVRAHRGANGALELEFQSVATGTRVRAEDLSDVPPQIEAAIRRGRSRATDQ